MSIEQIKTTSQYKFRHRLTVNSGKEELEVDVVINIKFQNGGLVVAEMSLWPRNIHSRTDTLKILKKLKKVVPEAVPNAQMQQFEPMFYDLKNTEFLSCSPKEIGHPFHPESAVTTFHGDPLLMLEKIEKGLEK